MFKAQQPSRGGWEHPDRGAMARTGAERKQPADVGDWSLSTSGQVRWLYRKFWDRQRVGFWGTPVMWSCTHAPVPLCNPVALGISL